MMHKARGLRVDGDVLRSRGERARPPFALRGVEARRQSNMFYTGGVHRGRAAEAKANDALAQSSSHSFDQKSVCFFVARAVSTVSVLSAAD